MKTLIGIPTWRRLEDKGLKLLDSIAKTADREYHLYLPVGDNSHACNANLCIKTAKSLGCRYVMLMDSDTYWQQSNWLSRLETCLDNHRDWNFLIQGDQFVDGATEPVYGDETQRTPYTTSAFMFFRTSDNILFDQDYLFTQSLEVDFIREYRRHELKTGILYSVGCIHERKADCDTARGHCFKRYQQRNEKLFNEKWGGCICHYEPTIEQWAARDKWRGIKDRTDIDNLEDFSQQFKTIEYYTNWDNPLLLNDIFYCKRKKISFVDYFGLELYKKIFGCSTDHMFECLRYIGYYS